MPAGDVSAPPENEPLPVEEPPMDDGMGEDTPPEVEKLMQLLQSNPDKAEDVYKYAEGIIGDSGKEEMPPEGGEEPPMDVPPVQESKEIDLDEVVDDIIGNDNNRKITPTSSKPKNKSEFPIYKQKLFKNY